MKNRAPVTLFLALFVSVLGCAFRANDQTSGNNSVTFDTMVDVGGYRLYVNCVGKAILGSPTVCMDAGGFDSSAAWNMVQPGIARFTRVCVYDRAGLGRSERRPNNSYTSQEIVKNLHNLIVNAHIAAPFVLVGHSFGGMNVRLYASQFPNEVVGMVLVDSVHEDEMERWVAMLPAETKKQLPASDAALRARLAVSESQVRAANWHSDIPLIVLTHGRLSPDDYGIPSMAAKGEQLRFEMQNALARLSSRSKHIIAEKSGHYIQRDQPELVIDAIRQVVEATRTQARRPF